MTVQAENHHRAKIKSAPYVTVELLKYNQGDDAYAIGRVWDSRSGRKKPTDTKGNFVLKRSQLIDIR